MAANENIPLSTDPESADPDALGDLKYGYSLSYDMSQRGSGAPADGGAARPLAGVDPQSLRVPVPDEFLAQLAQNRLDAMADIEAARIARERALQEALERNRAARDAGGPGGAGEDTDQVRQRAATIRSIATALGVREPDAQEPAPLSPSFLAANRLLDPNVRDDPRAELTGDQRQALLALGDMVDEVVPRGRDGERDEEGVRRLIDPNLGADSHKYLAATLGVLKTLALRDAEIAAGYIPGTAAANLTATAERSLPPPAAAAEEPHYLPEYPSEASQSLRAELFQPAATARKEVVRSPEQERNEFLVSQIAAVRVQGKVTDGTELQAGQRRLVIDKGTAGRDFGVWGDPMRGPDDPHSRADVTEVLTGAHLERVMDLVNVVHASPDKRYADPSLCTQLFMRTSLNKKYDIITYSFLNKFFDSDDPVSRRPAGFVRVSFAMPKKAAEEWEKMIIGDEAQGVPPNAENAEELFRQATLGFEAPEGAHRYDPGIRRFRSAGIMVVNYEKLCEALVANRAEGMQGRPFSPRPGRFSLRHNTKAFDRAWRTRGVVTSLPYQQPHGDW